MNIRSFVKPASIFFFLCLSFQLYSQKTYSSQSPQADYDNAMDLYNKGKYGSALEIFDALSQSENSNLKAGSGYFASLCAARLFHPDATQRMEKFISTYPQNAQVNEAWFELGKQYFLNKDYHKTLGSFKQLDRYELNSDQLSEYFFKSGYSYLKLDNLAKARESFALVKDKPGKFNVPANYYYGYVCYQEKNYETALQHFEKVDSDETFRDVVGFYIVQIYSIQGKYDELLSKALPLLQKGDDKKAAEISRLTGDAYYHKKQYKEALEYFKKFQSSNPRTISRNDQYEMGFTSYQAGNYPEAIKQFQQLAVNQDSLSQNAFYHLGDCYLKTNQKRYAFNAFSSASKIKLDPVLAEESLFN